MPLDVEAYVKQQLEDIDLTSHVRAVVKDRLQHEVLEDLKMIVRNEAQSLVREEVEKILNEGIIISDGFKTESYESFEKFFKKTLKSKVESYDIRRTLQSTVKKRVEELFKGEVNNAMKEVIKQIQVSLKKEKE